MIGNGVAQLAGRTTGNECVFAHISKPVGVGRAGNRDGGRRENGRRLCVTKEQAADHGAAARRIDRLAINNGLGIGANGERGLIAEDEVGARAAQIGPVGRGKVGGFIGIETHLALA